MHEALRRHFTEQAGFCTVYGSPFTGQLLERMGEDLAAGGPVAALVGDWPTNPRADALSLRLAGALHEAALSGRAPALAAQYPAQRPDWSMDEAWPAARAFLADHHDWAAQFIVSAPQTNEVRRTIGLLAGFLDIAARHPGLPIDTLEIGASAGLNLNWDRFAYRAGGWSWGGPSAVEIDTDWRGPPPALDAKIAVRHRAACDLNPLDIRDPAQRIRLRSYVWPDQQDRLARFDGAADMAAASGLAVERADAGEWLERRLAVRADDAVTVVYHSIFFQYPPQATRDRIAEAIGKAGAERAAPLVWLRFEPEAVLGGPRDSLQVLVDTVAWPGGERRTLALSDGHARFVEMV